MLNALPVRLLLLALLVGVLPMPALAQTAKAVRSFSDWTLYANRAPQQICFLASSPSESQPTNLPREKVLLYVSAWPREGVRSEVSVKLGGAVRKGSQPSVTVSGGGSPDAGFTMFVKDDRAFVADPTQELKLLEAMRKGAKLTVRWTSDRGVAVADAFSLAGVSIGLQALAAGCPG